jgi:AcrR family transcriptional regulator
MRAMARIINSRSTRRVPAQKVVTKPRKSATQERSKALVDDLMRATARILVREGYEGLSTNRVAQAAGVSVGSLYQYFPNKEALVASLVERHVEETMGAARAALPALLPLPVELAVPRFVELMLDMHKVDPALHRVFEEQVPRVGGLKRIEASVLEGMAMARIYLSHHSAEIVPKDIELAAFIMVNTLEALTHAAVISRPELMEHPALAQEISACIVRYLKGGAAQPVSSVLP